MIRIQSFDEGKEFCVKKTETSEEEGLFVFRNASNHISSKNKKIRFTEPFIF